MPQPKTVFIIQPEEFTSFQLLMATGINDIDKVCFYLSQGAKTNSIAGYDMTPLMKAAEKGYHEILIILLAHNAKVNATREDGTSALFLAVENNQIEVVNLLLAKGADPTIPLRINSNYHRKFSAEAGDTPLHLAARIGSLAIVRKLIAVANGNINSMNNAGDTALHIAVRAGDIAMICHLMIAGADKFISNAAGESAVDLAIMEESDIEEERRGLTQYLITPIELNEYLQARRNKEQKLNTYTLSSVIHTGLSYFKWHNTGRPDDCQACLPVYRRCR